MNMMDHTQTTITEPVPPVTSVTIPYRPSFLDNFMGFIDRLPGPYWAAYLLFFVLEIIILHIFAWTTDWIPLYTFTPLLFLFPIWLWVPLALMTHLNRVALAALSVFGPLLDMDDESLKNLKYEFTTLPARSVILNGLFWGIVYFLITYLTFDVFYIDNKVGTLLTVVVIASGLISYTTGGTIYYYSLRQLRLVYFMVRMVRQYNLFRLDPVYAFSRVTSQIGISWMIMLSLTLLIFPIQLVNLPILALLGLQVVFAVAAFVLPLLFVNRRLVAEKLRLLSELNRRIGSTLERMHHHLDTKELAEVDLFAKALSGLNVERSLLISIPTWPWRAGTLKGFLTTMVLPIILFLIQLVVRQWLGM